MMIRITLLSILILIPKIHFANQQLLRISNEIEPHLCIPESEFYVSEIKPGDRLENVLSKLGKQSSIEGSMDFPSYHYPNITVQICNGGRVGSLSLVNPNIGTESGIRLGLTRKEIFSILGIPHYQKETGGHSVLLDRNHIEQRVVQFQNCSDVFSSIQFKFSESDILEKVRIGYDCP